jgi:hypothetical protein
VIKFRIPKNPLVPSRTDRHFLGRLTTTTGGRNPQNIACIFLSKGIPMLAVFRIVETTLWCRPRIYLQPAKGV